MGRVSLWLLVNAYWTLPVAALILLFIIWE